MPKLHVKKNDEVIVISGTQKGKRGKIIAAIPKKDRVIVEGVMMIKKHVKKSQSNPNGSIVEKEGTIHVSNVMKIEEYEARQARRNA